jgi:hypothetical protein
MRREINPCARELFHGCCKLKQCNTHVTTRAASPALVWRGTSKFRTIRTSPGNSWNGGAGRWARTALLAGAKNREVAAELTIDATAHPSKQAQKEQGIRR